MYINTTALLEINNAIIGINTSAQERARMSARSQPRHSLHNNALGVSYVTISRVGSSCLHSPLNRWEDSPGPESVVMRPRISTLMAPLKDASCAEAEEK
ncbi:hypothetical protein SeLEV6574_g06315 [Synchytrium endobioticum]|uniref:Uncharacterized protein n=1 Tax=Synchytrium endobioticum TaxID=286115 RepID=A0A507CPA2_9FUNG|nr:hypothetical protein SeLEV6574_g06315 [Synchytrium endobioticum]